MIYFIQAGDGPIKIGRALQPLRRLGNLQVGNHEILRLLAVDPAGGEEAEIRETGRAARTVASCEPATLSLFGWLT